MSIQESNSKYMIKNLKVVQAVSFQLLCAFDDFCRKEGFSYSLAGGSLLGAVRHGGFIPWDDDVDLFMLRPDFDLFIERIKKNPFIGDHYEFVCSENREPVLTWVRMIDTRTKVVHRTSSAINNLWIDILPLDAVPNEKEIRKSLQKRLRKMRRKRLMLSARPFTGKTKLRALLKTPIVFFLNLLGAKKILAKKITCESQSYPYEQAEYVAEVVAQAKFLGWVKKDTFRNSVMLSFEGRRFPVMPDYEFYLDNRYGPNYMQLPPENKRRPHAIKVWIELDQYEHEQRMVFRQLLREARMNGFSKRLVEQYRDSDWDDFTQKVMVSSGYPRISTQPAKEIVDACYHMCQFVRIICGQNDEQIYRVFACWYFMINATEYYGDNVDEVLQNDLKEIRMLNREETITWMNIRMAQRFTDEYFTRTLPELYSKTKEKKSAAWITFLAAQNILNAELLFAPVDEQHIRKPAEMIFGDFRRLRRKPSVVADSSPSDFVQDAERSICSENENGISIKLDHISEYDVLANYVACSLIDIDDVISVFDDQIKQMTERERLDILDKHALPENWTMISQKEMILARSQRMANIVRKAYIQLRNDACL